MDFEAYMSSIDHLQRTFTHSQNWPRADLTTKDAVADMAQEAALFESRRAFAYAVLTPDGTRERGCIYVRPSLKAGYDAVVRLWVTERSLKRALMENWSTGLGAGSKRNGLSRRSPGPIGAFPGPSGKPYRRRPRAKRG